LNITSNNKFTPTAETFRFTPLELHEIFFYASGFSNMAMMQYSDNFEVMEKDTCGNYAQKLITNL